MYFSTIPQERFYSSLKAFNKSEESQIFQKTDKNLSKPVWA